MEVVNGALRSVRESQPAKVFRERTHSQATILMRQMLFLTAFESLEAFEKEGLRVCETNDDTDLQILGKFSTSLGRLYDCCRDNEFQIDHRARSLQTLDRLLNQSAGPDSDTLESRFIRIAVTTLTSSERDPRARYLNQGQRGSLNLLRTMASFGSSTAY